MNAMRERYFQFTVGLLVIAAAAIGTGLTLQFGEVHTLLREKYAFAIHFREAGGLQEGTPVRLNGIPIGTVAEVGHDHRRGGVLVLVHIDKRHKVQIDATPHLSRSILGDASIEFSPGVSGQFVAQGDLLEGVSPRDPYEIVDRVEVQVSQTLEQMRVTMQGVDGTLKGVESTLHSFAKTSDEWGAVAKNVNTLMETKQGSIDEIIEDTAGTLHQLTSTLKAAEQTFAQTTTFVSDPKIQLAVRETVEALPKLMNETQLTIEETRKTVTAARDAVGSAQKSLDAMQQTIVNVNNATEPIAKNTPEMMAQLSGSLNKIDAILEDVSRVTEMAANNEGTLHRLASDPELYQNLNQSAVSMSVLIQNLDMISRDIRIFSDKVARHPELLGVSGAIRGSSGVKEATNDYPSESSNGYVPPPSDAHPFSREPLREARSETERSPTGGSLNLRAKRQ